MSKSDEPKQADAQYYEKVIEELRQRLEKEKQKRRDSVVFVVGVFLGILGNLFAANYLAYIYPNGIPHDQAMWGAVGWGFFIALYAYMAIKIIRRR